MVLAGSGETVKNVTKGVGNIATATDEEVNTSAEISRNVERIASITEKNSSAIHHTLAASGELEEMAHNLRNTVNRFKI